MTVPLFSRPGAVALVDDDRDFLAMLASAMSETPNVGFFSDPWRFLHHLEAEMPFFEADVWAQQQIVHQWVAGEKLVPKILDYWMKSTERFALTRVCVVDRQMPLDGFEVLERLRSWHGHKLLLTGHADDTEAVAAFNDGLIDKFVTKRSGTLVQSLSAAIGTLQYKSMPRIDQIWRGTLSREQNALLSRVPVAREIASWARDRFVEHVVIGAPFGVLGVGHSGDLGWIQIVGDEELSSADITDSPIRAEFGLRESATAVRVRQLDAGWRAAYFPLDWVTGSQRRDWSYHRWLLRERVRPAWSSVRERPG